MQRLLIATDFSSRSDRAIRRASLIARKLGASMTLVHIVDIDRPAALIESDQAAATRLLADTTATLAAEDGVDASWMAKVEDAHAGIIAAGDEVAADLVVIGPHRSRLSDVFVGTTAERLVKRIGRPLLVAAGVPATHYRRALLALDFDEASPAAGTRAMALGVFDHMDVAIMHAFDAPGEGMMRRSMEGSPAVEDYVDAEAERASQRLDELVRRLDLPGSCQRVVSTRGSPARSILEVTRDLGCDLVVLGANQRAGLLGALVGSVTADVIRDAKCDILIIPVEAGQ